MDKFYTLPSLRLAVELEPALVMRVVALLVFSGGFACFCLCLVHLLPICIAANGKLFRRHD